ncbi:hypothetical protein P691DRAFT_782023 [Macrolepiota fuliginosa MF-IS2]|uniref:SCP domain-containing protein n=1 Tax=Macrolepiota fuliginosa MF-IS2 TaxID=1400762 RepID=A0A9P5XA83_9AGAR|nr:hypothetical protein P691DRAFT_782023 [Macrolepiota fuliginosa MF-IS2]
MKFFASFLILVLTLIFSKDIDACDLIKHDFEKYSLESPPAAKPASAKPAAKPLILSKPPANQANPPVKPGDPAGVCKKPTRIVYYDGNYWPETVQRSPSVESRTDLESKLLGMVENCAHFAKRPSCNDAPPIAASRALGNGLDPTKFATKKACQDDFEDALKTFKSAQQQLAQAGLVHDDSHPGNASNTGFYLNNISLIHGTAVRSFDWSDHESSSHRLWYHLAWTTVSANRVLVELSLKYGIQIIIRCNGFICTMNDSSPPHGQRQNIMHLASP